MMACVMSGQSCILPSRILLPRSRYDEGLEIFKASMEGFPVGDPWSRGNMQGPQISAGQRQKVLGLIQSRSGLRRAAGDRWRRSGGPADRLLLQPTLLADVDPDSRVAQEESSAPSSPSCRTTLTTRPSRSPTTRSTACRARSPAPTPTARLRSRAGCAPAMSRSTAGRATFGIRPGSFGGTKQSGLGRRNGEEGYKEYLEAKTIGMPE